MMEPPAAAVIALKPTQHAKSRLAVPDPRGDARLTMALDTLSALSVPLQLALCRSDQPALEVQLRRAGIAAEVITERAWGYEPGPPSAGLEPAPGFTTVVASALVIFRPCRSLCDESSPPPSHRRSFIADASGSAPRCWWRTRSNCQPHFRGPARPQHHHASGAREPVRR